MIVILGIREEEFYCTQNIIDPAQFVPQTKFPEHAWCKVKSEDGIELFIGVCYDSNNGKIFGNDTHLLLRQLLCEVSQYHVLIMGDFNYPDIDWETIAATDRASIHCESKKNDKLLPITSPNIYRFPKFFHC